MSLNTPLSEERTTRQPFTGTIFRALVVFDTIALLFAATLHVQGMRIPLGFTTFDEPQIVPAAIVEGAAGIIFAVSAAAIFTGRRWAWSWTLFAHIFAILGFLLGIFATRNGTSAFNHVYHFVLLGIFMLGLLVLLAPSAKAALGGGSSRARR